MGRDNDALTISDAAAIASRLALHGDQGTDTLTNNLLNPPAKQIIRGFETII
jgi:hypothetical protein